MLSGNMFRMLRNVFMVKFNKHLFVCVKMSFFVVQKMFKTSLNLVFFITSFKHLINNSLGFKLPKKYKFRFIHFLKLVFTPAFTHPNTLLLSVKNGFTLFPQHLLLLLNIFNNSKTITRSV